MTSFSNTWNSALPADSEDAKDGASRIRAFKTDVVERVQVDHSFALDANDGAHKKVTLLEQGSDPTPAANTGFVYAKDLSGVTQIYYMDSAGTITPMLPTTGDVKLTLKTAADIGWVLMNDGTIGNASSGGTTRANADTVALFTLLWTNTADADCAVSSGRGASAAADYAANKTIALPKALGRALAIYGSGSGLTARALAKSLGTETHTLLEAELPTHTHTVNDPGHLHTGVVQTSGGQNVGSASPPAVDVIGSSASATTGITVTGGGSGDAHNNMQPTTFLNVMIKL